MPNQDFTHTECWKSVLWSDDGPVCSRTREKSSPDFVCVNGVMKKDDDVDILRDNVKSKAKTRNTHLNRLNASRMKVLDRPRSPSH